MPPSLVPNVLGVGFAAVRAGCPVPLLMEFRRPIRYTVYQKVRGMVIMATRIAMHAGVSGQFDSYLGVQDFPLDSFSNGILSMLAKYSTIMSSSSLPRPGVSFSCWNNL